MVRHQPGFGPEDEICQARVNRNTKYSVITYQSNLKEFLTFYTKKISYFQHVQHHMLND